MGCNCGKIDEYDNKKRSHSASAKKKKDSKDIYKHNRGGVGQANHVEINIADLNDSNSNIPMPLSSNNRIQSQGRNRPLRNAISNQENINEMRQNLRYNEGVSPNFEPYLVQNNDQNFNFPEIEDVYMGTGLKHMKGYISSVTKSELDKKRESFWDTRVEGSKETWEFLRNICTNEELLDADIATFLLAAGVKPYKGCINITFDSKGAIYEIPNYCINDPIKYDIPENKEKKRPLEMEITITVKKGIDKKNFITSNRTRIGEFKEAIITGDYPNFPQSITKDRIRLFYGGKELLDEKELWVYDIEDSSHVLMMIRAEVQK